MLLAAGLSGPQLLILGLLMLVIAVLLRRGHIRGMRSRSRDVAQELRSDMLRADSSAVSQIRKMEVRLFDFGREVEGRIQTRIAQLDQLLEEADREIVELRRLLEHSTATAGTIGSPVAGDQPAGAATDHAAGPATPAGANRPLTVEQRRMIARLLRSGYTPDEIARLVDRPLTDVRSALDNAALGQSDAA